MHVEFDDNPALSSPRSVGSDAATDASDFTGQLELTRLEPATRYWYRVWLAGRGGDGRSSVHDSAIGTFATPPPPGDSAPVSFAVGGDVGGQRYCRNAATGGYRIFGSIQALKPDFFIANGDMIYADGACPAEGPDGPGGWENIPGDFPSIADPAVDWTDRERVREVYLDHWRYNRADPHFQRFLASTPTIAQWDDHEVINDFGAPWSYWNPANASRPGFPNLVQAGRDALFSYWPMTHDRRDPDRIYRSLRFGKDLELFVLDARSYRDRNDAPDSPDKQMLGEDQIEWLLDGLSRSTATWKVISNDVPISIPTGSVASGRDGWANLGAEPTGFEQELGGLLHELDAADAKNVVFVATAVHFARTIRYQTDADGDGDVLELHEAVNGPLNAVRGAPGALDLFANPTSLYAEGGIFNFGFVRIARQADGKVHLIADVRDENGVTRPGSTLDLTPQ